MTAETIFALSSGSPPAALAVVRISGERADQALAALAGRVTDARRASLTRLRWNGRLLDEALAIRFPGPASATGEDVVELHLHGGRAVVAGVLEALGGIEGLRPAEAGEFTRRAFENGRIDFAQAEGLADLLEAETEAQRRAALSLAGGALSRKVGAWQARLLAAAAQVEAAIDFADEEDVEPLPARFGAELAELGAEIGAWLARPPAERLKEGVRVVLAGPPNAGKSSLFNAIIGREAAIVSATPGTTRDLVEAPVAIGGVPFLLIDTAGLRASSDEVEALGVERARLSAATADILLWLGPVEEAPDGAIAVASKMDIQTPDRRADLAVSAMTGAGLARLADLLLSRAGELLPPAGEIALSRRHRQCLREVRSSVADAMSSPDLILVAEGLRRARVALDAITGRAGVDEMLDTLFGRFCIGK